MKKILVAVFILFAVSCSGQQYTVGYSFVIDSTYLNVRLPNGELPRRANGTYLYWKVDENGDLIPVRRLIYDNPGNLHW